MFDSPENRYVYETALLCHGTLINNNSSYGKSYRSGYLGESYAAINIYEYWRAGKENAKRHKQKENI